MRALTLAFVVLAAACGKVGTSVEVTLDASPALTTITNLHVTVAGNVRTRDYDVTPPAASIPPAIKLAILVPPSVSGMLDVTITAFDGAKLLATANKAIALRPGEVVPLSLTLGAGGMPDLGAADLRGLDLTGGVADLTGNALPDGSESSDAGEDLAVDVDLASNPDLVTPLLPLIAVPTQHDFLGVNEDTDSSPFDFMIQNGTTVFMAPPIVVELVGANAVQFGVASTCDDGAGLAGSGVGMCTATVTFKPDGAGPRSATLLIHSATHSVSIQLSGLAIGKNGAACTGIDAHCQNNHCVDGFCCDVAAASCGACRACNVATKEGTCSPVPVDTDPKNNCTTGCYDKCDGAGACKPVSAGSDPHNFCTDVCMDKCNGAGACRPALSTKACGSVPCTNGGSGHTQWQSTTNGALTCSGTTFDCVAATACPNRLVCDPTSGTCKASCTGPKDCTYRSDCNTGSGQCEAAPGVPHGGACNTDEDCGVNGQTGDDHNICLSGGTCQNCSSSMNCPVGMICDNAGGGLIACFDCDGTRTCSGSPWGPTCTSGRCTCNSNSDCFDTIRAPNCKLNGANKYCGCTFGQQRCFNHEVCVGDVCKLALGITCTSPSQCGSNKCTNGRCAP